jgi:hypothetical protein
MGHSTYHTTVVAHTVQSIFHGIFQARIRDSDSNSDRRYVSVHTVGILEGCLPLCTLNRSPSCVCLCASPRDSRPSARVRHKLSRQKKVSLFSMSSHHQCICVPRARDDGYRACGIPEISAFHISFSPLSSGLPARMGCGASTSKPPGDSGVKYVAKGNGKEERMENWNTRDPSDESGRRMTTTKVWDESAFDSKPRDSLADFASFLERPSAADGDEEADTNFPNSPVGAIAEEAPAVEEPLAAAPATSSTVAARPADAPALPDCLMMAEVKDFPDWHTGFKAHASETTFAMNGTTYDVSIPRSKACDEAKTNVFCEVGNPNKVAIAIFAMDFAVFGPVMEEAAFKEM